MSRILGAHSTDYGQFWGWFLGRNSIRTFAIFALEFGLNFFLKWPICIIWGPLRPLVWLSIPPLSVLYLYPLRGVLVHDVVVVRAPQQVLSVVHPHTHALEPHWDLKSGQLGPRRLILCNSDIFQYFKIIGILSVHKVYGSVRRKSTSYQTFFTKQPSKNGTKWIQTVFRYYRSTQSVP